MEATPKNISKKIDDLDESSEEVREILGKTPSWIIRSGTVLIFALVLILLLGSALISYNEVIPAEIFITSKNPPVHLKANTSGKLTHIFVKADQDVLKDEVLAEIENTATLEDIRYLKEHLKSFKITPISTDSIRKLFPPNLDLGPLQNAYGEFTTRYQNYSLFNSLSPNQKESTVISLQLYEQRNFLKKQRQQLLLFQEDLALSKESFDRSEKLFTKGVISKAEYENAFRAYLEDKQRYQGFQTNISNTRIAVANFKNLLTKSDIKGVEFKNTYRQQLEKTYQNLTNEILNWELLYLLKSPINGRVTVFDVWNQYQNVSQGETVFTVVPENLEELIGRVMLPVQNSGKVKIGQRVIIKLANYPFQEWGSLEGRVLNVSEVPRKEEQVFYTLYIGIADLKTSYGKRIEFKQEMQGTAEIVVEELSIIERVLYQLRKAFNAS